MQRGDDGVEHDGDLVHAAGNHSRGGKGKQPAHVGIEAWQAKGEAHLRFRSGNGDDDHLQHPRRGDAPGEGNRGHALLDVANGDQPEQHGDEHDVEQARGEGRHGKAPERVEHARIERDQRHAEQKGERDTGQQDGEVEFSRVVGKARREQQHQPRHDEFAKEGEGDEGKREPGKGLLGKGARPLLAALAMKALGEERDEGSVERALREQAAEQVGDAEGDEEGVGDRPRAKHRGDQNVADEAEDAAPDGHGADGGEGAVKWHLGPSGIYKTITPGRAPQSAPSRPWSDDRG